MNILDCLDHVATIGTAAVAVWAGWSYRQARDSRRKKLELYLEGETPGKLGAGDTGARSLFHLMAALKMSEGDLLTAAFQSKLIEGVKRTDADGVTKEVLLRHSGASASVVESTTH